FQRGSRLSSRNSPPSIGTTRVPAAPTASSPVPAGGPSSLKATRMPPAATRQTWRREPAGRPSSMSTPNRSTRPDRTSHTRSPASTKGRSPSSGTGSCNVSRNESKLSVDIEVRPPVRAPPVDPAAGGGAWPSFRGDQVAVRRRRAHELLVRAAVDDAPRIEQDDLVAISDRAEPVGDDQARAATAAQVVIDRLLQIGR